MKISTFLLISCTLIGCGSDDGLLWEETCFIGIVIGPEKCSGATIIQVIKGISVKKSNITMAMQSKMP